MPQRIAEILSKYKTPLEAALLPAVVVLVGLSAFGLGRLSSPPQHAGLVIQLPDGSTQSAAAYRAAAPAATAPTAAGEGAYVASKSGTKYYLPSCSGASRIKEENKVWFATLAQAEAAGYTAAANCPGL